VIASAVVVLSSTLQVGARSGSTDPFAILTPEITINGHDREALDEGKILVKMLPAPAHELAVLAAGSLKADGEELSAKIENIAALKRSRLVPEIGRFSDPPALKDLDALTLDEGDLKAVRTCRPGDCALKLSEREIDELQQAAAGASDAMLASIVNQAFRRIVLTRAQAYLSHGLSGVPHYATGDHQVDLGTAFASLLQQTPFVQSKAPQLGSYLAGYPDAPAPSDKVASFLYWSKEKYAWKPIISVTQMTIIAPRQSSSSLELLVASKEIFATRYTSGGLVLNLLIRGSDARAPHYLVYVNRAWVDGLHAWWRPFISHRVRSEGTEVFAAARARIERTAVSGTAEGHPARKP
jgi:hypothetical protein